MSRARSSPGARSFIAGTAVRSRLSSDWVELEPWPEDIAFARGVDLLRGHVRRAYERAGKTG